MRPFPKVQPVYLSTFVKNLLHISGTERTDFAIIEHTQNRVEAPDPAIRGVMLGINKVYALYAEIPSLSALKAEHLDSIAVLIQASFGAKSSADLDLMRERPPLYRRNDGSVPPGCLSIQSGESFIQEALERMRALEYAKPLQQAQFAWLLPFRWAFSAPYAVRNLETGVMIFLLLRMHWGLPFHTYGWTREEVWTLRNEYSKYWLENGLWENPDFCPPLGDREETLIGTTL